MTLNRVKLGYAVTFIKYLASVVSLIFLPETLKPAAATDMRYFARSKFSRSLVHTKKFSLI